MFSKYKKIPVTKFDSILEAFSTSTNLNLNDYDLLIYSGGGQSRSFYRNLSNDSGTEVLWTEWSGPKWTSFLSFIPGQAGLLKVLKQERLMPLYIELAVHSVSDLYYIPKALTENIAREIINAPLSHDAKRILKNELSFLYLQCEMHQTTFTNGEECYCFDFAIGPNLPVEIKALFSNF